MSYILDALRRAEAQRTRGRPPGLHESTGGAVTPSAPAVDTRRPLIFLLLLLLILGLLAAGYAILRWQTDPAPGAAVAVTSAAGVGPKMEPAPIREGGATAAPDKASPPLVEPAQGVLGLPRKAVISAGRTEAATPAPSQTETRQAPGAAADAPARVSAEKSLPMPAPRPLAQAQAQAQAPVQSSIAGPILRRQDLPPEIQRMLPQVVVSGSVYSSDPTQRMLVVNGDLWREGDQIQPDLILEQIRRRDAVLRYRGYRFTVGP